MIGSGEGKRSLARSAPAWSRRLRLQAAKEPDSTRDQVRVWMGVRSHHAAGW